MKVSLNISGGLVPRLGVPDHMVDSDDLAEHDNHELQQLVSAAIACAAAPPAGGDDLRRDAQTYQITVRHDSATTVLAATDGDVPEEFAALRDWLRQR